MILRALLLVLGVWFAGTADAAEGKRVALVIGNGAYADAPLKNPANDARTMAQALRGRGFEIILRENATKSQMETAVADFGEKLNEGATGIFFFAGHGMQVNGRNFLIPVDAKITSEQRVRLETLDVEVVIEQMAAARARVSLVILDACRNNPFERRFRSTGGGLAQINAPEGTLIAYATAPGKTAADGDGANGLYTAELLRAINTPGLKVEDVFKQVRINVSRASNGAQVPWEASSLTGDLYFQAPVAAAPAAIAAPPPPPVQGDRELAFWDAIKTSSNPDEFEAYLQQFPNGTFAPLARTRLQSLRTEARTPRPAPAPAPAQPPAQAAPRLQPAPAPAPTASLPQTFDGVYDGELSGADGKALVRMMLQRQGDRVSGRYSHSGITGEIVGRIDGHTMFYAWRDPGGQGRGVGRLMPDGAHIRGTWGYGDQNANGGTWIARRGR